MTNQQTPVNAGPALTPTQLLEAQVRLLTEMRQAQELELGQLHQQTKQLQQVVKTLADQRAAPLPVTVEDFNMPFAAMVGFLVKLSLASIPAALFIGALWVGLLFVLSSIIGLPMWLSRFP